MQHPFRQMIPALAATLVLLAGCATPNVLRQVSSTPRALGPISLFEHANGTGAVSIRIIDKRARSIQSFADAAGFDSAYFRLSNATKLKGGFRLLSVGATESVFTGLFQGIPSDVASNYFLSVGLFKGVASASWPQDPGYQDVSRKVGEGGSPNFSVAPGSTTVVTVTINAVGNLSFDSQNTVIDQITPIFQQGDNTVTVDTQVNKVKDPDIDTLNLYVLDASGSSTYSVVTATGDTIPVSTLTASMSFPIPGSVGNYLVCVEGASGSYVQSRRYRTFAVEQAASISVNLN